MTEEKMFTCVKSGMSFKISPNNAAGWRALALWLLGYLTVLALFLLSIASVRGNTTHVAFTALFIFSMIIWAVTMIRWMMARSEMIDVKELLALKRELDRQKRQGR